MTNGNDDAFATLALCKDGEAAGEGGLTKREYFAAMAMATLANNMEWSWPETASVSVKAADALIAALNETK